MHHDLPYRPWLYFTSPGIMIYYHDRLRSKFQKKHRQENEMLTPARKKNLDETRHKYHRALEQLSRL